MKHSLRSKTLTRFSHKIMFLFFPKYIVADWRSFTLNVGCIIRMNWLYAFYFVLQSNVYDYYFICSVSLVTSSRKCSSPRVSVFSLWFSVMQWILGSYSPYLNKVLGVVLKHCATNRKVALSIPGGIIGIFH